MEFINQYFIEIISSIAIITLLLITLLLKNSSKTTKHISEDKKESKEEHIALAKEEQKVEPTKEIEKTEKVSVKKTSKETPVVPTTKRIKREVIAHDKITKDDFTDFKGARILVAEDNMINQKVITALLANSGIDVTIANDGQECINILKNDTAFSVILMDAHMPIVDGFQATRHIRKTPEYEHIPIIALSGDTAADDIQNMLNVGMEGHLEKPLRMDALYDILYMYTTGNEADEAPQTRETPTISTKEFDSEKGLEICGGDKEFFLEILTDFTNKYEKSADEIRDDLNSHNSIHADKELLDISGVAANIGADHLHTASLELKNSIANPDDLEYINLLKEFKRSLVDVIDLIKEYQAKNAV